MDMEESPDQSPAVHTSHLWLLVAYGRLGSFGAKMNVACQRDQLSVCCGIPSIHTMFQALNKHAETETQTLRSVHGYSAVVIRRGQYAQHSLSSCRPKIEANRNMRFFDS